MSNSLPNLLGPDPKLAYDDGNRGPHRICVCSVLVDEAATKTGDLYIQSVCFSLDGKYLATGAEDKQIRVRAFLLYPCVMLMNVRIESEEIWDIAKREI